MEYERPDTGRRAFLALGASAVLAGCVRGSSGDGSSDDSTTMENQSATTDSPAPTTMPDQPSTAVSDVSSTSGTNRRETAAGIVRIRSNRSQPQATANIPDSNPSTRGSTTITVWNDAEIARNITVGVAERDSGRSLFRKTYRFEPDSYVEIDISKVGKYTASVGIESTDLRAIDFPTDSCNSKTLDIAIRPDGTVASTFGSTEMACATVTATNATG